MVLAVVDRHLNTTLYTRAVLEVETVEPHRSWPVATNAAMFCSRAAVLLITSAADGSIT